MSESNTAESRWEGDVIGRDKYADYLTKYLDRKVGGESGEYDRSYSLALDAKWGIGKTFFIENWKKDLDADPRRLNVLFDAWKSDYLADPLVSFMAALKSALDERASALDESLGEKVKSKLKLAACAARRAVMPAVSQVLKGVVHKATGVGFDELCKTFSEKKKKDGSFEGLDKAAIDSLNNGLDKFFLEALKEQEQRQQSVDDFKDSVRESLDILVKAELLTLPIFVFVDELDRCRPNYAIEMLEGIKHLFDIKGICYVIATNITQLSESIRAVYGAGFDGSGYLKRMFDAEYSLPADSSGSFSRFLIESRYASLRGMFSGAPVVYGVGDTEKRKMVWSFDWVVNNFGLDLRSQLQLMDMIVSAASGIERGKKVHFLWLAILCAVRHKSIELFDRMERADPGSAEFVRIWEGVVLRDGSRVVTNYFGESKRDVSVTMNQVVCEYLRFSSLNLLDHDEMGRRYSNENYPDCISCELSRETPREYSSGDVFRSSIFCYFDLVRNAGHFVW